MKIWIFSINGLGYGPGPLCTINPCVASGWGGNLPPYPVLSPLHQNCLEFFETLPWLFLDIYWLQNPKRIFPISLYYPPKFWWETKGTPRCQMVKNWFQAYLGLGVPQVEKYDGYIQVFMCIQTNDSSADFSWPHMQTGSSNNLATESDIDAISKKPMFLGAGFSLVYMPTSPDASCTLKFNDGYRK